MTEQLAQKKLTVMRALIVLVGLLLLMQLSFWADEKSFEVEGPSRIVKGPKDTLYIQIDRKIAKVSQDGEVLHVVDLDADAAIPEHIADFFVEDDGRLLIARRDSQVLQYYSPEGKLIKTHERVPSAVVDGDNHFCKFSKDSTAGILYLADTSHHRIQIYGPDEKEMKTILVPSGSLQVVEQREDFDETRITSPDTPLHYPNGLIFDRDRLIATDTGNYRIVIFHPDGALDKVIPVQQGESSGLINPFRVARSGDTVYAIMRGPNFLGGRVAAFDQITGQSRTFSHGKSIDPWDVFARLDDVLVADRESLSVLRYTPVGKLLDTFGKPSLQSLYADRQIARKTYQLLRKGSLAGMLLVLIWLLFASRRQRVSYDEAGQSLHTPVSSLQKLLGPMGSVRRKALLVLVPGLGQAAAGRILRAFTVVVILAFFVSFVVFSSIFYDEKASLPVLITIMLMTYTVWMIIALDGVRLSGKPATVTSKRGFKHVLTTIASPLLTVCAAITAQLLREAVVQSRPDVSVVIQSLFRALMSAFSDKVSLFSSVFPAAVLFGWGGAAAGMFATLSWQAQAGRKKILLGIIFGFPAGIIAWMATSLLVGARLGSLFYMPAMQGIMLSTFAYLFFRKNGMPLLVIPVAAAGAWVGSFVKLLIGGFDTFLMNILPSFGMGSVWMGTVTRIEFVASIAFFIHLAVWVAWNTATAKPLNSIDIGTD